MITRGLWLALLLAGSLNAKTREDDFVSTNASTASGISIPNAHWISEGHILRANRPLTPAHIAELKQNHIGKILVFKLFSDASAQQKMERLYLDNGYRTEDIKWIPFAWKDITSYRTACRQVIEALQYIKASESSGVLFHCTVGEDRTGLLSGLLREVRDGWDTPKAYRDEMCAPGYADGAPRKGDVVKRQIHESLSPLFIYLSEAVASRRLQWDSLTNEVCERIEADFKTRKPSYAWCG